ncbi:MAG: hypothetical protein Crog4KO_05680 [Crocinitomicaceae bacterium]
MKHVFVPLFFCLVAILGFSLTAPWGGTTTNSKVDAPKVDLMAWYNDHKSRSAAYRDINEIDRALSTLDSCINFSPAEPMLKQEIEKLAWIYVNRAYLHEAYSGNFLKAKENYLLALERFHEAEIENFLVARYVYQPLGNIHTRFGENEQAIRMLEQFIAIAAENNEVGAELNGINDLGRAYMNKGLMDSCENILTSGITKSKSDLYNKGLLYSSLAEAHAKNGAFLEGILASEKSLTCFRRARVTIPPEDYRFDQIKRYEIGVYTTLGNLYTKTEQFARAKTMLTQAEKDVLTMYPFRHRKVAKVYLALGDNYAATQSYQLALRTYHRALQAACLSFPNNYALSFPEVGQMSPEVTIGEALIGKARACEALKDSTNCHRAALEAYQTYFDWVNISIQEQQDTYSKLDFAEEIHAIGEEAIALTFDLKLKLPADSMAQIAYGIMDQSKGVLLSQTLQVLKFSRNQEDPEFLKLQNLAVQISQFERERRVATMKQDQDTERALLKIISNLDQEKQILRSSLLKRYPTLQSDLYQYDAKKVFNQLKRLKKNESLINYFVGKNIYSVCVSDGKFALYRVDQSLKKEITVVGGNLSGNLKDSPRTYAENAYALYQWLVPKSMRNSNKNRWIVLPDGLLSKIPFEALVSSKAQKSNWKELSYLVRSKVISYAPTTTAVFSKAKNKAFGSFAGFAPGFKNSAKFPFLSKSELEVSSAGKQLNGVSFTGNEASKRQFSKALEENRIVHLSTHAGSDTANILDSWIAFNNAGDDKLLTSELLQIGTEADLVVLNACETGHGKYIAGEGVMSLARGFIASGSNCVITNLWRANHGTNAQIFEQFYQHLKSDANPALAMQQAKLDFLKSESTDNQSAHPCNWATPVVIGSTSSITLIEGSSNGDLIFWIALILAIIIAGLLIKLRINKLQPPNHQQLIN